jgi:hypothetical protein
MDKFEIDILLQFEASDLDEAQKHYDDLCDILSESGFEPIGGEIGLAIEDY